MPMGKVDVQGARSHRDCTELVEPSYVSEGAHQHETGLECSPIVQLHQDPGGRLVRHLEPEFSQGVAVDIHFSDRDEPCWAARS